MLVQPAAAQSDPRLSLQPRASAINLIASVTLVLSFYSSYLGMTRFASAAGAVARRARLEGRLRSDPVRSLALAYPVLFAACYGWNAAAHWIVMAVCGLLAWLAIGASMISVTAIAANSSAIMLPGPLRRWFMFRLKQPRDLHYVKLVFLNSFVIMPLLIGVIAPPLFCFFTVLTYLLVMLIMGLLQESLIHSDVHNHFFRLKHLKQRSDRLVFKLMNLYLKTVIPFISGRFPYHYTVEHGMIHHAENNGVHDVQSTVWYDRKSFIDYCRFAWRQALQLAFSVEWYQYLARKGMKKPVRVLVHGQLLRFGAIVVIGSFNLGAAILLFLVPFITAVPRSTSIFLWHGLIDTTDPENVYTNSVNIAAGAAGIHAWHVEHHVQPNDHWSHMRDSAERDRANYEREQTIVFVPHPRLRQLFLRAMWTRRFDLLATMCLPTCAAQRDPVKLAQMIEQRTNPLVPVARTARYRMVDDWLGRKASRYLVGGRFPVERRGQDRVQAAAARFDYVEG